MLPAYKLCYYAALILILIVALYLILTNIWRENATKKEVQRLIEPEPPEPLEDVPGDARTLEHDPDDTNTIVTMETVETYQDQSRPEIVEEAPHPTDDSIGFEELCELVEDDDFIDQYNRSILRGLKHKRALYTRKHNAYVKESQKHIGGYRYDTAAENMSSVIKRFRSLIDIIKVKQRDLQQKGREREQRDKLRNSLRKVLHEDEDGFRGIIGRDDIKHWLAQTIYTYSRNPHVWLTGPQGIILMGNSGIGKTKMGRTIGFVMSRCGMMEIEEAKEVSKGDFVTCLVNETTKIARDKFLSSLGGVVIIDEAYMLGKDPNDHLRDHSKEVVDELLVITDDYGGCFCPILMGYQKEMNRDLLNSNQGLRRRFNHPFILENYTIPELTEILNRKMIKHSPELKLKEDDLKYIHDMFVLMMERDKKTFVNQASSVELMQKCIQTANYTSLKLNWRNGPDRRKIIVNGLNTYLYEQGFSFSVV